ncbi:adenylyl-sulfate kinase [Aliikangiella sp. G2MR2-5]|uniref:adenylyl-sulfate kinase n=1 Tax=Aliikangiella sp. G2MR2-5 TaxID=2788943 RepID=UPI0018AAF8CB|nr:adenylyl-sulfate kinase [Aliikangiella sp. G2MR2-5]
MNSNIVWHNASVTTGERNEQKGHAPCLLWYTGLSGSGKSTIANAVDRILFERGCHTYLLDGDNVRHGLNSDLGFDDNSRKENIRRITEVANLFADAGLIVGTAFISPFIADREQARNLAKETFIEVFVDTPLEICEQRDPKGLYTKARKGEIPNFTGISSPYEAPPSPQIHIETDKLSIEEAANQIVEYLVKHKVIPA